MIWIKTESGELVNLAHVARIKIEESLPGTYSLVALGPAMDRGTAFDRTILAQSSNRVSCVHYRNQIGLAIGLGGPRLIQFKP